MPADLGFLRDCFHVVCIHPESKSVVALHAGNSRESAEQFCNAYNLAGYNCYWTVNRVRDGLHSKPSKGDIVGARFLHADVDAHSDLPRVQSWRPSLVIHSGGGLQPLWRVVDNTWGLADLERANQSLAAALDADACWNIDRLLRVPGTVNYPDARKRARGRVPVVAALAQSDNSEMWDPRILAYLPPPPVRSAGGDAEFDGSWEPTLVADLVPPPRPVLLARLTRDVAKGGRSEHVSTVVTEMAKSGYSDAQIMGVLMHPENAVSSHIYDQPNPTRAARRKTGLAGAHRMSPEEAFAGVPVATTPEVLSAPVEVTRAQEVGATLHGGGLMTTAADLLAWFKGCVYVSGLDVALMPDGSLINSSRFNAIMGGHRFSVASDGSKTVRNAWDAWTNNELFKPPQVANVCFRPTLPPRHIVVEDKLRLINCYVPVETETKEGDPAPFLRHLQMMIPDELDRRKLLTYMASLLQNPGRKFGWAPVIQGTQGNGKTLLTEVLARGVGRRYTVSPNVGKMANHGINFTAFINQKLLVIMEEIYSNQRRQLLEELKPLLTNERVGIELKGKDEYQGDNFANFMFLTNHKDGVPISDEDRRFAIWYCAQQHKTDLDASGMTETYFAGLWKWLRADGFAICNWFLRNYECEAEFDPAQLASRAPATSSTGAAIAEGEGRIEQEIREMIAEGLPGFCGGWISLTLLGRVLGQRRMGLSPRQLARVLERFGYVPHPVLVGGRTNGPVLPDNARARLYVRRGHLSCNLLDAASVADHYTKAQAGGGTIGAELAFAKP